ncbi:uncharacterized protein At3g28850-like [Hibiscus syriacus]|uniref:uncharacterized protein At3g28850-like n=1 Tax=Hibiscus syriacus TaxID=106335 RepID=UPI001924DE2E|nr:uncharacterized protein At3g28850-like [Hibiscus syriacus]
MAKWLRSSNKPNPTKSPSHFSFASFKDIDAILREEEQQQQLYPRSPKTPSVFYRIKLSTAVLRAFRPRHPPPSSQPSITFPNADQRVVVYLTSLRVVRKTFEDCKTVRSILRGFCVPIDEWDVSLDSSFLDELHGIIGRKSFTLSLVLIGGTYISGAEEVKRLHECGELKKLIGGLPLQMGSGVCDLCQGLRFILCSKCNGSHKVYSKIFT